MRIWIAWAAALCVLWAPSGVAENPKLTPPIQNVMNIVDAASDSAGSIVDAAQALADAATQDAQQAAQDAVDDPGVLPTDEPNHLLDALDPFASSVARALGSFADRAGEEVEDAEGTKMKELGEVRDAATYTLTHAVDEVSKVGQTIVDTLCRAPLSPDAPTACNEESIYDAVDDAAQRVLNDAGDFVDDTTPLPGSVCGTLKTALNRIVEGAGDALDCGLL